MNKIKIFIMLVLLNLCLTISAYAAPITLNAKELDLHDTIIMIANIGGLNVSVDDSVKGSISIFLEKVEPIDALNIIAKTKDLNIINENGIYIITALYATNSLMNSYVLPVKYGDAEKFRETIVNSLDLKKDDDDDDDAYTRTTYHSDGSYTEFKRKRHSNVTEERDNDKRVMVNKDVNSLILFGTVAEYERAKNLLRELDIPLKQVSIEAKILAIDKNAAKDLGMKWDWNLSRTIQMNNDREDDNSSYGTFAFNRSSAGHSYRWRYAATLNALITDGKAKMLSRPNITTIQGNEAIINVGSEIPVPTTSTTNSTVTTSFEYRDIGIILKCTPRINADGSITSITHAEVSVPQYIDNMGVYRFNKRSADTTVTLKDGEPMVIGGLIGKEEEKSIGKIPFLSDLPILGALFRNHHKSSSESELMIFLTAHVIE